MSLINQKTLNQSVSFNGIGLHSGKSVKLTVRPSEPDTGIIFKRIDLKNNNLIYPNYLNVTNTSLNTTISNQFGIKVSTIEHLMGALFCLGIDNALIEINNEEVPILDGSAKEFVEKFLDVGLNITNKPAKFIIINQAVEFREKNKYIKIDPSKLSLNIEFELIYENSIIRNQKNKINVYNDELNEIVSSRTFCLYEDIEKIKKMGLAKGGSLQNAIVVRKDKILNDNGLRNLKEFVNHKILDCIGDLYTSGYRVMGNLSCSQGGHYLTNQLLKKIFKKKENFSIIEISAKSLPHTLINKHFLRSVA